ARANKLINSPTATSMDLCNHALLLHLVLAALLHPAVVVAVDDATSGRSKGFSLRLVPSPGWNSTIHVDDDGFVHLNEPVEHAPNVLRPHMPHKESVCRSKTRFSRCRRPSTRRPRRHSTHSRPPTTFARRRGEACAGSGATPCSSVSRVQAVRSAMRPCPSRPRAMAPRR
uniref:Uncharacterized protein n=1 Tax=Aegilops tauschii subsp. strangulata TaxID=200361 RepID=A0A453T479_AEGTS